MAVTRRLLHFVEVGPQRILRHLLQIGVDRRVNAIAFIHGPIPADRRNHLLADIIDRIGLALRALPAADRDVFGLRRRRIARA